jgi:hypothetical protein
MRKLGFLLAMLALPGPTVAQNLSGLFPDITQPQNYALKRVSSYERTGANADYRKMATGETLTVFEAPGPGVITHLWFTIASRELFHLKKLVLRMYWDNESTPSVEAPIGDFFGLGLGEYFTYQSFPLAVGSSQALNSYFPMPFRKMGKITLTDEGKLPVDALYCNIDYRAYKNPLPPETLYFHAQYRQCAPCQGWTNQWISNGDRLVDTKTNLDGEGNYVWSDNYFSVAYWYQTEPHAPSPMLPPVEQRLPKLFPVGGPGNAGR